MSTRNAGVIDAARALLRMMKGERLTLQMLETRTSVRRAALRGRLRCAVDEIPYARRSRPGPGRPEEFWWVWPTEQQVTPDQVVSLAAARAMLRVFREGDIGRVLSTLLSDHLSRLPPEHSVGQAAMDRMFHASSRLVGSPGLDADVLDRVAKAVVSQSVIEARYAPSEGDDVRVRIEPWTVLFADEGVYLYGLCLESDEPAHLQTRRLYSLARLSHVRSTWERFAYPHTDEYEPVDEFRRWFGVFAPGAGSSPERVVLRFSAGWARYLRHQRVHPTQEEEGTVLGTGQVQVTLHVFLTYDLVRWIRGLGEDVEVLEPAGLAEWVSSRKGLRGRDEFLR